MTSTTPNTDAAWANLEASVRTVVETYSNVHRGSGQFSTVTSVLFERARSVVLQFLGLDEKHYAVAFCTPRRAEALEAQLGTAALRCLSSDDIGLPLGVRALVAKKSILRRSTPIETGGGTARLVSGNWVVWAKAPGRLEAGTPAIVNIIAFARALQLLGQTAITRFEPASDSHDFVTDILFRDRLDAFSGSTLLNELRLTLVGGGIHVPTRDGHRPYVNLDNAASTPTFAPILDTFCAALRLPQTAREAIIREVRSICARALNSPANDYDILFTSNTTEAINLVARSLGNEPTPGVEPVILNTLLEHNSNELPWRTIAGHSQLRLPVDTDGFIDIAELERLLRAYNQNARHGKQRIRLVAVSGASNVLGTFNDLTAISRLTHEYGARLLVDSAQLVAHRKVDVASCNIDYLAFSAHKMYAPFGSGGLVVRKGLLCLAAEERDKLDASGTSNVAGIAALGKAFVLLQRISMDVIQQEEQALTAHALDQLSNIRGIRIFGIKNSSSLHFAQKGGVVAFDLKSCMPKKAAELLAELGGVGVRFGCHCSHLLVKHLHRIPAFLEAVQRIIVVLFPKLELPGVVRMSLGIENTRDHVDALVVALNEVTSGSKLTTHAPAFRKRMREFVEKVARSVYG
jgi:selenocysteine lyase/cysteine desulfurase